MPLYDYRCPNGHFEESRYISRRDAADTQVCRECGSPAQRQFSVGTGRMLFFEEACGGRRVNGLESGPRGGFTTYAQYEKAQRDAGITQVSKDDMLHLMTQESMRKSDKRLKRQPGWIREFAPYK